MLIKINDYVTVYLNLGYYISVEMFSILKRCLHENRCNSVKNHHV